MSTMTIKDGLLVWAARWRGLRAWGRPLDEVRIEFRQREACYSTGHAYPTQRRLVVTAPDMPLGLECLLHELAHLAAPGDEVHGDRWRNIFVNAVAEVTGIQVSPEGALPLLTAGTEAAMKLWWKASGNEFGWKILTRTRKGA